MSLSKDLSVSHGKGRGKNSRSQAILLALENPANGDTIDTKMIRISDATEKAIVDPSITSDQHRANFPSCSFTALRVSLDLL